MTSFRFHFQTHDPKDLAFLRKAGFDSLEISRLCQLRDKSGAKMQDCLPLPQAHLRFLHWLVQQGRLKS
jgi:hypothetical protein